MTLSWNLVLYRVTSSAPLRAKVRQKLAKLEQHLQKFPPEAVHLQVVLDNHRTRRRTTASLTLKLPSNILHSAKSAADPVSAFELAIRPLLRQLTSVKAALRREADWQAKPRRTRRAKFTLEPSAGGAVLPSLGALVRSLIERFEPALLEHVRRLIAHDAAEGRVPRDAIDAEAVVDEVVQKILTRPEAKPEDLGYRTWLYRLARIELSRRYRQLEVDARTTVPIDEIALAEEEESSHQEGDGPAVPRVGAERGDWPHRDTVPDETHLPPDSALAHQEFLGYVHDVAANWPKPEREAWELHFVEGFEAEELAMITGTSPREAQQLVERVGARLREMIRAAAMSGPARRRVPAK